MKYTALKALFLIISLFLSGSAMSESFAESENVYITSIDNEFIKAKLNYGSLDTGLFNDIQDVKISISIDKNYSETEKLKFYEILFGFVKDINTSLYANKKLEERDYRRAIRILPSVFYYMHADKLEEFLTQNYMDALKVIPYLPEQDAAKSALASIGIDYPLIFYSNVEEVSTYKYFTSVFIFLGVYDPATWILHIDKNPFLSDIAHQSSNPIIKKIIDIKDRLGANTSIYSYLDEIIRNSFNDSHEVDFSSNRDYLTKKVLAAALNSEAYGCATAMNSLTKNCKWLFENFIEGSEGVLSDYGNNEILAAMVMCQNILEYEDYVSLVKYLKGNDAELIPTSTVKMLPKAKWMSFLKKMQKADLISKLADVMDAESAASLMSFDRSESASRLPLENLDWFSSSYNFEKEKLERAQIKNKVIASTFQLNKTQLSLLNWSRNLNKVDSNIVSIIKSSIGGRFIDYLARYHPNILANNREKLKNISEFPTIVNKLAENAPNTIKKYLGIEENPLTQQLKLSKDRSAKILLDIYSRYKFNSKAYVLIHKILNNEMTIERAHEIGNSDIAYMKTLMNSTIQKNPKGIHSVEEEQNQVTLKFIREINDHPSNSHPNLQIINTLNPQELYSMMVLGKEEIFHFAFENFYNDFYSGLGNSNLIEFLPSVNHYKYREFCVLMANFRKFPELISKNTTAAQRTKFIENFVHIDFSDVKCIEQAAVVCEFINNCDHAEIQLAVQTQILEEFKNAEFKKDQLALAVYSLLASNIGHRALLNNEWYTSMEKKFNKYTLSYIDINDVKNKNNKIIEVCYFYNDEDGVVSFNSYINTFRSMPKWYLQDLGSYYYISSLEGNEYDIFANKPQFEQLGQSSIRDYLVINKLEPTIVVHRGHSYHSQKTIDQLIGSPRFIFMGSCGGYYKISELLVRSPNAQILSTKQVGTMSINDPMLRTIHETFRANRNIDWPSFWTSQEAKYGTHKDFKMYVPPHKNNGALFVNAFFKVIGL
jgi:hypothetical protein